MIPIGVLECDLYPPADHSAIGRRHGKGVGGQGCDELELFDGRDDLPVRRQTLASHFVKGRPGDIHLLPLRGVHEVRDDWPAIHTARWRFTLRKHQDPPRRSGAHTKAFGLGLRVGDVSDGLFAQFPKEDAFVPLEFAGRVRIGNLGRNQHAQHDDQEVDHNCEPVLVFNVLRHPPQQHERVPPTYCGSGVSARSIIAITKESDPRF